MISNNKYNAHIFEKNIWRFKIEVYRKFVFVGRHNSNSFICQRNFFLFFLIHILFVCAHQFFANTNPFEATYALTSSIIVMNSGRNNNNGESSVRKPSINSNKASMSFELYALQDGIKSGRENTFGLGRPSGKSTIIRSN